MTIILDLLRSFLYGFFHSLASWAQSSANNFAGLIDLFKPTV